MEQFDSEMGPGPVAHVGSDSVIEPRTSCSVVDL